jgi:5-methylcytosine-specific restriction protein A
MPTQPPRFSFTRQAPRRPWQRGDASGKDRRIRGRAGQKLRHQVLSEEPLCRACLAENRTSASVVVDHIKPLSQGGGNERSNLQGLCTPHHDEKTAQESIVGRDGRW